MEGPLHLLSLKVMRVSRPEPASAWQPFYSSSPSFSAHSSASIISLQGNVPLSGHPKTLRDMTHASELLTLPSSFGSIQLGETFSSCLCVNNEAQVEVDGIYIKTEMQTITTKVALSETEEPGRCLAVGDTLESLVHHEIKELGQHVLACTVIYQLPPNARPISGASEDASDPSIMTFRKFYKFSVTNPLSVKTKVHLARSPSALLSSTEMNKTFLEVHIQNLTLGTMFFKRMVFECAEGWDLYDLNNTSDDRTSRVSFKPTQTFMHPQDIWQYIYVLTPTTSDSMPVVYDPGSVIPLGRLDLSWQSSFGEPGRLLTSMLSRRIPSAPVQQPASALPQYIKRSYMSPPPSRPQTPQQGSRSNTPPPRPSSPSKPPALSQALHQPLASMSSASEFSLSLLALHIPQKGIVVGKPFIISFSLKLSSLSFTGIENRKQVLTLAVQHLQPPRGLMPASPLTPSSDPGVSTPRGLYSALSSALSTTTLLNYDRRAQHMQQQQSASGDGVQEESLIIDDSTYILPPPYSNGSDEIVHSTVARTLFVGSSVTLLSPIYLSARDHDHSTAVQAAKNFDLTFVAHRKGFTKVGGLRILLLDDNWISEEDMDIPHDIKSIRKKARVLKEFDTVAEVWVST